MTLNRIIAIFSIVLFLFIVFIGFQFSGKLSQRFGSKQTPALPTTKVTINGTEFMAELATTSAQQQKGLSGRSSLADNQGMLFLFDQPNYQSFWMKDMKFPIDIIFIRDNTIVSIAENATPPKSPTDTLPLYTPEVPINMVLEINAGLAKSHDIKKGDLVTLEPEPEQ